MLNRFSFILFLSILCLTMPLAALAAKPIVIYDYEGPDDIFIVECDGYDVNNASWAKIVVTRYLDKDGNFVREHVSIRIYDSIYYNTTFPDIFIQNQGAGNGENISQWYYADGSMKESGLPYRIMLPGIGKRIETITRKMFIKELKKKGVEILTGCQLVEIRNNGIFVVDGHGKTIFLAARQAVLTIGNRPDNRLYDESVSLGFEVYKIGDCLEPRSAKEAIYESLLVARTI
mgnify:CR=1 FL=1